MPPNSKRMRPLGDVREDERGQGAPGASPGLRDCPSSEAHALATEARAAALRLREAEQEHTLRLAMLARAATLGESESARTLESFAESARVSRQTLQEFVTLTTRWEPARVASLLAERDTCGRPVTRTILLRLARGPSAQRAAFDEAVARGKLDLARLFPDLLGRRRVSGTVRIDPSGDEGEGTGKSQ